MLHEKCVVKLLQNFFCCEKTSLLDEYIHLMKIYVKDLGDKRKDLFKTQHEGFQELESAFF